MDDLAFIGGALLTIGVALFEFSYTLHLAFGPVFSALHAALSR